MLADTGGSTLLILPPLSSTAFARRAHFGEQLLSDAEGDIDVSVYRSAAELIFWQVGIDSLEGFAIPKMKIWV